jgi:hypothetical protein
MGGSKFLPKVALAFLALGGTCLAGGCAENRSSFFIEYALALDATDTTCTIELSDTFTNFPRGTLDLDLTESYAPILVFGNQLVPRGSPTLLRTETSRIQVEGAEITVTGIDGGGVENGSYSIPIATVVNPDTDGLGESAAEVELIPPGVVTDEGDYMVEIKAFGRTLGGTEIESGLWTYPVRACRGCLARCPPPDEAADTYIVPPCDKYGNDYAVDCAFYKPPCDCLGR